MDIGIWCQENVGLSIAPLSIDEGRQTNPLCQVLLADLIPDSYSGFPPIKQTFSISSVSFK